MLAYLDGATVELDDKDIDAIARAMHRDCIEAGADPTVAARHAADDCCVAYGLGDGAYARLVALLLGEGGGR